MARGLHGAGCGRWSKKIDGVLGGGKWRTRENAHGNGAMRVVGVGGFKKGA